MPGTAQDMLPIRLSNKGVFQQHGLVGFPEPLGEPCLEALFKKPAHIAQIGCAEYGVRDINSVPQPGKGVRRRFGALPRLTGCRISRPGKTPEGQQQRQNQQKGKIRFACRFHRRSFQNFPLRPEPPPPDSLRLLPPEELRSIFRREVVLWVNASVFSVS